MAKSSKVEDYWRQHNVESLFKELTHTLVQRMPSDPAVAIVNYLQKKFPKSFKTPTDNNNVGIISKTMANSLQLQPMSSPRLDTNFESTNDMRRRTSTQSTMSGIATTPRINSAFTDLLKQDTSFTKQAPELNLRNLVFANRLSQQVVKLGKDIQSDRDILEEELITPIKTKTQASSIPYENLSTLPEDIQQAQTHEQPSVRRLIEYKQQIRTENDRRLHREKLAELAQQAREKEQILQADLPTKPQEIQQQQKKLDGDDTTLVHAAETSSAAHLINKPIVRSKEEEDILNDENILQPRRRRYRERYRHRLSTSHSNTPYGYNRYTKDFNSQMRRKDTDTMPMMLFGVCKVCGNMMNNEEKQSRIDSQQVSAAPTARSFGPQPSTYSIESSGSAVDDWFESASNVSGAPEILPWRQDDITPTSTDINPFQRNVFRPINNNNDNTDIMHRRSPQTPIIITDDEKTSKQLKTPRMSESDIFIRTPELKIRRSSSSRSTPSPVMKKQQTNNLAITNPQLSKTMKHPSITQPKPSSNLTTTLIPTRERRMSSWSVCEHSPDDSDDN